MEAKLPSVCIIGAGSSGIAACKAFKEKGIPYQCYEASDQIGGNWVFKNPNGMSSAYRSLHINTSREKMAFSDFPMPSHFPDFPSHELIADYFNDYVNHFNIRNSITFNTKVMHCARTETGCWRVELENGEAQEFDVLIVANGHHWDPRWPEPAFPGEFNGQQIHSHHYIDATDPLDFRDKNVVIVGMGNSAMDIACELGRKGVAKNVFLSVRRGTHIVPKYFGSDPLDFRFRHPAEKPGLLEYITDKVPYQWLEKTLLPLLEREVKHRVGSPEDYGLPKPQHRFGRTHPTISDEIHIRLGSGDVLPKPNIKRLCGDEVEFADGSREAVDIIIYSTGYKITFPFFDETLIAAKDNDIALYQRMVDPKYPNLLFLALVQPLCAMMPIAEMQSQWMADYLTGRYHLPDTATMVEAMFDEHQAMKSRFVESKRHTIQIDCMQYTFNLRKEWRKGAKRARKASFQLPVKARAKTSTSVKNLDASMPVSDQNASAGKVQSDKPTTV